MDEIIKQVVAKFGLPEDKAKGIVEMIVKLLKEKLPAPMAGQLDSLLGGGAGGLAEKAEGIAKGLGGLFGKKK